MTLRKITNNNTVKYISKVGKSHSEQTPPISKERKKSSSNINFSQKNRKFIKNITGGFKFIEWWILKFYFY